MEGVGEAVGSIDYASIIAIAAKSPFGILALLIIGVSLVACVLFWNASDKARVFAFFLLFFGMSAFGGAVFYERLEQEKYHRLQAEEQAQEEKKQLEAERQRRHELVLAEIKQREEEEKLKAEQEMERIKAEKESARLAHEKKMTELRQREEQCKPREKIVRNTHKEWIEEDAEESGTSKYSACKEAKRTADEYLSDECDDMDSDQIGSGVIISKKTSSDCDCEDLRTYPGDDGIYCEVERKGLCKYVLEEEEQYFPCS